MVAYIDADWAGSILDRRSTSRYFTFVGSNLVTWRSKKQSIVARSSVEAKFKSMVHGICELLWFRMLIIELGLHVPEPMNLYCNNKAAINIAHDPVQHDKTKHVEVDRHFIKDHLKVGRICILEISLSSSPVTTISSTYAISAIIFDPWCLTNKVWSA